MKIRRDDLLQRIAKGDERAFAKFYYQYQDTVAKNAFRLLKDREQAREIVQDVFVGLWQKHHLFADITDLDAYVFIATKNSCLAVIRTQIREKGKLVAWKEEQGTTLVAEEEDPPLVYTLLDQAIDELPPQQQKVYLLSRHRRKKYAEIAEELKISKETVKKYLKLANQSIQSYIKKHKDAVISFFSFFFL